MCYDTIYPRILIFTLCVKMLQIEKAYKQCIEIKNKNIRGLFLLFVVLLVRRHILCKK